MAKLAQQLRRQENKNRVQNENKNAGLGYHISNNMRGKLGLPNYDNSYTYIHIMLERPYFQEYFGDGSQKAQKF